MEGWSTAWLARTPTWSGFRWKRRDVSWRASAFSASGGLELKQHVLRARNLHGLRQRCVGPDDCNRLLQLFRRDRAVGQVEPARGGEPRLEVGGLSDDAGRKSAGQVSALRDADPLLGLPERTDQTGQVAIGRASVGPREDRGVRKSASSFARP